MLLGARQYDPGIARFTTPDVFIAGALDLQLGLDPLTGNRYLFAAANPVAFYEDGHSPFSVLKGIAKAAIPFIPVVGTAVDLISAATGRDLLDGGRKMTGGERALALAGAVASVVPVVAVALRGSVKLAANARSTSRAGRACGLSNSFTADTPILMANGTTKPIEDIAIGDWVWATDPDTGHEKPKQVTFTISGHGEKTLVDLTVDGQVITATDGHPIYNATTGEFTDAADLRPGDLLQPAGGLPPVAITGTHTYTATTTVHNFTVADHHTYPAGDNHYLVHNTGPSCKATPRAARREAMRQAGIPTSQQPDRVIRTLDGPQFIYRRPVSGGGKADFGVYRATKDRVPGHRPHYEAGPLKHPPRRDPTGRYRVTNQKAKVEYR